MEVQICMIIQLHSVFDWQFLHTFSTDSLALAWHYAKAMSHVVSQ